MAGGRIAGRDPGSTTIRHWAYDSRLPFAAEGACFLALGGGARAGVAYVPELVSRGVRLFCVSETDRETLPAEVLREVSCWVVSDVLSAVQTVAAFHRQTLPGAVLGITGSNGKTIVKEWTYALLRHLGRQAYRSPGSHNSQLGVALSLLHASGSPALIEAGISQVGEMSRLAQMIRPTVGLLTNLGAAHDAGFTSREEKLREKLCLFATSDTLIYSCDDPWLDQEVQAWADNLGSSPALLRWTSLPDRRRAEITFVHFAANELTLEPAQSSVLAKAPLTLPCPFQDAASRQNLAHAIVCALHLRSLNLESSDQPPVRSVLAEAILSLPHGDMRLQAYAGRDGLRIVDDSYSADVEGFVAAAEFFTQQAMAVGERVWIVGLPTLNSRRRWDLLTFVRSLANQAGVTKLITIGGKRPLGLPTSSAHFDDTATCLAALDQLSLKHATVLVKGPRTLGMDAVARRLREQSHELRLEIDLGALAHNIAAYRARLGNDTKICVMVKARAYGTGAAEVAAFFEQRGVDYLAVATIDEGIEIRRQGVMLPIIVAHVLAEEVHLIRAHQLQPEVSSLAMLRLYASSAREVGVPVHIKVDTGMRRLGFDATSEGDAGIEELVRELRTGHYRVASVFSHLSASDRPAADEFSRKQDLALRDAADAITDALGYRPLVHLLNSAGAWRLPELRHDMVRLGLGIYGLGLEAVAPNALEPAHRWVARIVQLRRVAAGDIVGYNLGGAAAIDRVIGVVNVGYADGLRRSASDGAYALSLRGRRCPTVGSVCMDFTMIDLVNCPEAVVGDEVEVFGRDQPVGTLAAVYGTIAYEVFTGIGPRVRRVFYR